MKTYYIFEVNKYGKAICQLWRGHDNPEIGISQRANIQGRDYKVVDKKIAILDDTIEIVYYVIEID